MCSVVDFQENNGFGVFGTYPLHQYAYIETSGVWAFICAQFLIYILICALQEAVIFAASGLWKPD